MNNFDFLWRRLKTDFFLLKFRGYSKLCKTEEKKCQLNIFWHVYKIEGRIRRKRRKLGKGKVRNENEAKRRENVVNKVEEIKGANKNKRGRKKKKRIHETKKWTKKKSQY